MMTAWIGTRQSGQGRLLKAHMPHYDMLYTIAAVLLLLWLLGLITSYTLGGFVHLLLVIAVVVILIRIIRGQPPI